MKRSVAIVNPARLSLDRKLLLVETEGQRATVPLEDLAILVLDHDAIQLTGPLLGELGEAGVAVVVCNAKHMPTGVLLPYEANTLMAQTLRGQIAAKRPVQKRLWQRIVQEKIRAQGRTLIEKAGGDAGLGMMAHAVLSGDTTNREGVAANIYFSRLFGRGFRRLRQSDETEAESDRVVNAMLNYGYAVLRACVARAIVGAGLHPALGVHHRHRNNAFSLADDLMEPLRPLVDRLVFDRIQAGDLPNDLTPELKRWMLRLLTAEVRWQGGVTPLDVALEGYAAAVRRCLLGEIKEPGIPGV